MNKRIGIVVVSYGILEHALHLPEGHRVLGVRPTHSFSDTFEIAVEGPSLPEREENAATPHVRYEITVTRDADCLVPAQTFVGKFEETRG